MTPGETLGTLYTSGVGTELDSVLGASDEDSERSSEDSSAEEFRQAEERGAAQDFAADLKYYDKKCAGKGCLDTPPPPASALNKPSSSSSSSSSSYYYYYYYYYSTSPPPYPGIMRGDKLIELIDRPCLSRRDMPA